MAQTDRHIPEKERCSTFSGAGWKAWTPEGEVPQPAKWVVCRECIGTGRTDQKGRKRQMPDTPPA